MVLSYINDLLGGRGFQLLFWRFCYFVVSIDSASVVTQVLRHRVQREHET